MANVTWVGGAAKSAQVQTFAFAGTWEVGDLIRVSVGQKVYDYAVTSTTIATFLPLFVIAYNALGADDYPEMAEMTASSSSPTLTFTSDEAGVPFTITLTPLEAGGGAADAQTIEAAGVATTGTTVTTSSGPNDWSTAKNWSGGAVPVTGDTVTLESSNDAIKYGFAQSAVTLARLDIQASFTGTGTLGLPALNQDSTEYPEYRARALALSATILNIGEGVGQGSGRININVGSAACTLSVRTTSSGLETDTEAVQWKGTHAANVANIYSGSVAIAGYANETATVATLRLGGDAQVRCGAGCTLGVITQGSGFLRVNSAVTTITLDAGTLEVFGTGAVTTITNNAGVFSHATTGTITTYVGGGGSSLDRSQSVLAGTVTNCTLLAGASLDDPNGTLVFTNDIILLRCRLGDVRLDVGVNRAVGVA